MRCTTALLSTMILTAGPLASSGTPAQDRPTTIDGARKFENVEVKKRTPQLRLNLPQPNLRPTRIHLQTGLPSFEDLADSVVEVLVDVQNAGQADAPQAEVLLSIAVINPHTGQKRGPSTVLRKGVSGITAGASGTFYIGDLKLPNTDQDWDLGMEATVDPSRQLPESDKEDNRYYHKCRVFGRNSTGAPPPGTPAC